ncbi:MAG TPA: hypothetical protein VKU19_38230 [Bryobacteraceae bacterium]|nr:hypothetical protein [Bryobacteraceae bacterium]
MPSPILAGTNPLQNIAWPVDPNKPTGPDPKRTGYRPDVGVEGAVGLAIPVDLTFPLPPKTVYEGKFIRFKFGLDAKYEVVRDDSPLTEVDSDVKFDPWKKKPNKPRLAPSYTAGLKHHIASCIDTSATYKLKWDTIEMVQLLVTDPKKFKLALLRNLDVVFGANIPIRGKDGKPISECLKTVGIGLTFDPDLCIFSILLPVTVPFYSEDVADGEMKRKYRISTNMVLKFAPTKTLWIAIARRFGLRKAYLAVQNAVKGMTRMLPSEVAAAEATDAAAVASGGALTELTLYQAFCLWFGVMSIALPIALTLTDFMIHTTRKARAAGVRDGDLNLYAQTYLRVVYDQQIYPHGSSHGIAVQNSAGEHALQDINERGRDALQTYLERNFNGGRKLADANGVVHGQWEINPMAERMWLEMRQKFIQ